MAGKENRTHIHEDELTPYELYLVIRKKFKLIVGLFIVTVVLTSMISYLMKPIYRGSFIIKVPSFSTDEMNREPLIALVEVERLIKQLDDLRREKQLKKLSESLNMEEEKTAKIVSLKARALAHTTQSAEVTADILDPQLINELKDSIPGFLNQYQPFKERVSEKRERLLPLKDHIHSKIKEMEALVHTVTARMKKGTLKNGGLNPVAMEKDLISLRQELIEIENEISSLRGFEISVEPVVPRKPVKPKTAVNITIAGIMSILIGLIISFFLEWLEKNRKAAA